MTTRAERSAASPAPFWVWSAPNMAFHLACAASALAQDFALAGRDVLES